MIVEEKNIPIQVISICNTKGELLPLRFRFEDEEHEIQTVNILETVSAKEINYVGIEAFLYTCKAFMYGVEKMFELKYTVRAHKWVLFRMLY